MGKADTKLVRIMEKAKKENGMTWVQVAKKSGVAFGTIWGWLNGRHSMRLDSVMKVLNALGMEMVVRRKRE